MTTRLTLTLDVPDDLADNAEQLLHAIARHATKVRTSVDRRALTGDEDTAHIARQIADVMLVNPFAPLTPNTSARTPPPVCPSGP